MAPHAGFGAVMTIRQSMLQDMVQVLYNAGKIQHLFRSNTSAFSAEFFLDMPKIEFSSDSPDSLFLNLQAWGPLTVKITSSHSETRKVIFTVRERIPHQITLQGTNLVFGFDASQAVMESMDFKAYAGGVFSPQGQAMLESAIFFLQIAIISFLNKIQDDMLPSFNIGFLGPLVSGTNTRIVTRSLQNLVAIGFDMQINDLWTSGNPAQMVDTTAGLDAGHWINPALLPIMMSDAERIIRNSVRKEGATLDHLNFSLKEGSFYIEGKATKSPGSVMFSMDLVPQLYRPGEHVEWYDEEKHFSYTTPAREELWFQAQNVHVDVHKDWWITLFEILGAVLSFGIAALVIESIVSMIRDNIAAGFTSSGSKSIGSRVQEFTLPGVAEPRIRMKIDCFDCHVDGVQIACKIEPQFASTSRLLDGPREIAIEDVAKADIKYQVKLPLNAIPDDPELKIRWTVRQVKSNQILLHIDERAASNTSIKLNEIKQEFYGASRFSVECRIYTHHRHNLSFFIDTRCSLLHSSL